MFKEVTQLAQGLVSIQFISMLFSGLSFCFKHGGLHQITLANFFFFSNLIHCDIKLAGGESIYGKKFKVNVV